MALLRECHVLLIIGPYKFHADSKDCDWVTEWESDGRPSGNIMPSAASTKRNQALAIKKASTPDDRVGSAEPMLSSVQTIVYQVDDNIMVGQGWVSRMACLPKMGPFFDYSMRIEFTENLMPFVTIIPDKGGSPKGECQLLIGSYEGQKNCCDCQSAEKCKLSKDFRQRMFDHPEILAKRQYHLQQYLEILSKEFKQNEPQEPLEKPPSSHQPRKMSFNAGDLVKLIANCDVTVGDLIKSADGTIVGTATESAKAGESVTVQIHAMACQPLPIVNKPVYGVPRMKSVMEAAAKALGKKIVETWDRELLKPFTIKAEDIKDDKDIIKQMKVRLQQDQIIIKEPNIRINPDSA